MTTIHRWFNSGDYHLLGHMDLPRTARGDKGVLLVPPFGYEDLCAYRPLLFLGRTLAAAGIPVLRFDLPGTGDSSGGALDGGLLEAWVQSIGAAAAELRAGSGVGHVAVAGVRLGAMLALMAAARGADVEDLVLWSPAATGRAALRELRAFATMEEGAGHAGPERSSQPDPGLAVAGFLLSTETQRALEAVDLTALPPMNGRRVMLLSRDDFPADARLLKALKSCGCAVEVKPGAGYAAMVTYPHEAAPPASTTGVIQEFLTRDPPAKGRRAGETVAGRCAAPPPDPAAAPVADRVVESVYTISGGAGSMFGVLSEPAAGVPRTGLCVLLLNAGAVRHTGPGRMWVSTARRWAARGVASLRLDLEGIGESDGQATSGVASLYQTRMVDQIELAMDSLKCRLGSPQFAAVGLCGGAFWAFHAAIRNPEIRAAVLLNPRLFFWDPEVDRRRELRRAARGLTDWKDWRRLVRGRVPLERLKRAARTVRDRLRAGRTPGQLQIPPEAMAQAWAALERNRCRVALIFAEGEPLLSEMEEEGQGPPVSNPRIRSIRFPASGHTFNPPWAQRLVQTLIDRELEAVLREGLPDRAAGAFSVRA